MGRSSYDSNGSCKCGCPGKPPCEEKQALQNMPTLVVGSKVIQEVSKNNIFRVIGGGALTFFSAMLVSQDAGKGSDLSEINELRRLEFIESQGKLSNQQRQDLIELRKKFYFGDDYYRRSFFPNGVYGGGRHEEGQGNPAPLFGQEVLNNSFSIGPNTTRRVGVSGGQIVVLDITSPGVYHGHVRTWDELVREGTKSQQIRNALIKNGVVDLKGRFKE